jgi:uncharacterized protein YegL
MGPMEAMTIGIAVVTFGPVSVLSDFQTPDLFQPTTLPTTGDTPMGAAILQGLEMLRRRKDTYKVNGIDYYRPWVFLITDGGPTDSWQQAAQAVNARWPELGSAFSHDVRAVRSVCASAISGNSGVRAISNFSSATTVSPL